MRKLRSGATIGSVVANPSPLDHEAKRYREIDTFCFYAFGASLLADEGVKTTWAACRFLRSGLVRAPAASRRDGR